MCRKKLENIIDLKNPIVLLSEKIIREIFDNEFEKYYSKDIGPPAKPFRLKLVIINKINRLDEKLIAFFLKKYKDANWN